ncbi:MAG: lipid-A-disaccharide synthase [Roseovarius sp.]|nr:lipid-A-disaccharide synthase [Roseovarius sp.]
MKVFLIAGEASGDMLGASLMVGLKSLADVEFSGVGGIQMQREGLESLFPIDELSLIGIVEILPKYFHLSRRIRETANAVLKARPDVLITIDSPDFCLRVAKIVKRKTGIRTVHYVAPSVWAWRPKRAQRMAAAIDHVLALLPFEVPYMEAAGMECDFVGHPVASGRQATCGEISDFRKRHNIGNSPVLMVLPGSRKAELARLGPIFGESVKQVLARYSDLRLVLPTPSSRLTQLRELASDWPGNPVIISSDNGESNQGQREKAAAFGAANWALAASGTVSLELAAAEVPMVIAYDVAWLSRAIISKMIKIDTLTLVNLVSETRAIPECNGRKCKPRYIVPKLMEVMESSGDQIGAMRATMQRLGRDGEDSGLRAARAVISRLERR